MRILISIILLTMLFPAVAYAEPVYIVTLQCELVFDKDTAPHFKDCEIIGLAPKAQKESGHIVTFQCEMMFDDDGPYFTDCKIIRFVPRRR